MKRMHVPAIWVVVAMVLVPGFLPTRAAAADVFIGVRQKGELALKQIDHSQWDRLLGEYVDNRGFVDYTGWKACGEDQQVLESYLENLSLATLEGSRSEKLAFWINAYNALTIWGILREYPTSSIRNHTAVLWGYNIWKNLKIYVDGKAYSLEAIEHQVLRKMDEPRIHFAIVCASLGCPMLRNEAYLAEQVDRQLELNSKAFFSDPNKFRYDPADMTFYVSPILKWFADDFGSDQSARLKRIATWLPSQSASASAAQGKGSITYLGYDWGLNDQRGQSD